MDRAGSGIECGCCFATFRFVCPPMPYLIHRFISYFAKHEMIQCCETHLFCVTCMMTYASILFSEYNPRIQCIDQSGCTALIPESEVRRFLSGKMVQMWQNWIQRKEIIEAKLEGLVECPFCNYMVVMENKEEKLFRCGNKRCGVTICRVCKKPVSSSVHPFVQSPFISVSRTTYQGIVKVCYCNHPQFCRFTNWSFFPDVSNEILHARHTIEEAMSAFSNFHTIISFLKDSFSSDLLSDSISPRPSPHQKLPNMPNMLVHINPAVLCAEYLH